jgi:hypothetical protein
MRELITIKGIQRACLYGLGVLGLLGPSPPAKSKSKSNLIFLLSPPIKMEQTECSGMSEHKIEMPGNHLKEEIQHSEHGESLTSRISVRLLIIFITSQRDVAFSIIIKLLIVSKLVIMLFCVLFVCKCVLYCCQPNCS